MRSINGFLTQFKDQMREYILKVVSEWVRSPTGPHPWHRHGTVTETPAGGVKVRWDGDTTATARVYPCAASYTPRTVGDRVYAVPSGATWLVICKL